MTTLLSVEHLTKQFPTRHGIIRAVEDVSFTVASGETLALVGESGCGKTTVALSLLRLIRPDGGRVSFEGVDLGGGTDKAEKAWRQRLSIVFQNPYSSLDPRMRIRNIVGEPLVTAYGLRGRALTERVVKHLDEVGLGAEHLTRFPHEFSGGQRQRIAIARALALEPKLLILDEPTAALDVSVQAQVLNLLQGLQKNLGLSYLFISHNLATVENIADRVLVMYMGRVVEEGPVEQVFAAPHHPYTRGLLDSVPSTDPRLRGRLQPVRGEIPSALNPPPGCAFAPRCARAGVECRSVPPPLMAAGPGRSHACLHPLLTAERGSPQENADRCTDRAGMDR
jgi:peptide/nickel transport system ATP-binding protein/oligopeptide transport system ATP-binding protein